MPESGSPERFRGIYGLRNRLRATGAEARGVRAGWKSGFAAGSNGGFPTSCRLLGRIAGRLKARRVADQDGVFGPLDDLQDDGGPCTPLSVRDDDAAADKSGRKDAGGIVPRAPVAVRELGRPPASQDRQTGPGWRPEARADHPL